MCLCAICISLGSKSACGFCVFFPSLLRYNDIKTVHLKYKIWCFDIHYTLGNNYHNQTSLHTYHLRYLLWNGLRTLKIYSLGVVQVQTYLILLHFTDVACVTNWREDPPPAKDYNSLYCGTHFIMVFWNWAHTISEVCLYVIQYC